MRSIAPLACLVAAACSSHATLPGTNIRDTPQNRAVLDVFGRYKQALEARDAGAIVALTTPDYSDPGDPARALAHGRVAQREKEGVLLFRQEPAQGLVTGGQRAQRRWRPWRPRHPSHRGLRQVEHQRARAGKPRRQHRAAPLADEERAL